MVKGISGGVIIRKLYRCLFLKYCLIKKMLMFGVQVIKRNYLHAYDCAIIFKKLFDLCYTKQPVNIAHDKTISIKELVILIRDKAKLKTTFHFDTINLKEDLLRALIQNFLNL